MGASGAAASSATLVRNRAAVSGEAASLETQRVEAPQFARRRCFPRPAARSYAPLLADHRASGAGGRDPVAGWMRMGSSRDQLCVRCQQSSELQGPAHRPGGTRPKKWSGVFQSSDVSAMKCAHLLLGWRKMMRRSFFSLSPAEMVDRVVAGATHVNSPRRRRRGATHLERLVVPACLGERGRDALEALGTSLHRNPPLGLEYFVKRGDGGRSPMQFDIPNYESKTDATGS